MVSLTTEIVFVRYIKRGVWVAIAPILTFTMLFKPTISTLLLVFVALTPTLGLPAESADLERRDAFHAKSHKSKLPCDLYLGTKTCTTVKGGGYYCAPQDGTCCIGTCGCYQLLR